MGSWGWLVAPRILNLGTRWSELLAAHLGRFTPNIPGFHCPGADLNVVAKIKVIGNQTPVAQLVAE